MHILFCNWRDTRNPEGGGSEHYVETMARGLVERGHQVTIRIRRLVRQIRARGIYASSAADIEQIIRADDVFDLFLDAIGFRGWQVDFV